MAIITSAVPAQAAEAPLTTDAALVTRAQAGSRAAMTALHGRYARMVHAVVLAHAPAQDADDLTQDVFLRAMDRIDMLRSPEAFGGWLAAMARNAARDHRRRRKSLEPLSGEPSAEPQAPQQVEARRVLSVLRRLPVRAREVLIMRLVEGMTGPEIAARTGMTHGSVRVALHRGMAELRTRLEEGRP